MDHKLVSQFGIVMPADAGIQDSENALDARSYAASSLARNDGQAANS